MARPGPGLLDGCTDRTVRPASPGQSDGKTMAGWMGRAAPHSPARTAKISPGPAGISPGRAEAAIDGPEFGRPPLTQAARPTIRVPPRANGGGCGLADPVPPRPGPNHANGLPVFI